MGEHAEKFGLDIRPYQPVKEIDVLADGRKVVRLEDGSELEAPAVIMAAGGLPRRLGCRVSRSWPVEASPTAPSATAPSSRTRSWP